MDDELILLGKITRTQGFDGTLVILLEKGLSERTGELESVFVIIDGLPVPFFISWLSRSGDLLHVKFEGYELKEKVRDFTGCEVLAGKDKVTRLSDTLPLYLEGFSLENSAGSKAGTILKVVSYPMQIMLVVEDLKGSELLVPLNEDWIINIDKKGKVIKMDLPEGMTSVND